LDSSRLLNSLYTLYKFIKLKVKLNFRKLFFLALNSLISNQQSRENALHNKWSFLIILKEYEIKRKFIYDNFKIVIISNFEEFLKLFQDFKYLLFSDLRRTAALKSEILGFVF